MPQKDIYTDTQIHSSYIMPFLRRGLIKQVSLSNLTFFIQANFDCIFIALQAKFDCIFMADGLIDFLLS